MKARNEEPCKCQTKINNGKRNPPSTMEATRYNPLIPTETPIPIQSPISTKSTVKCQLYSLNVVSLIT
uniref:Uncharacterized protein n=1 Tax=Anguilla anguilla TaxID=7936 RepID=A0A0E9WDL4_ANGAN